MMRFVVAAALAVWGCAAQAAPIYRCGADGKTYSQVPCVDGKVVESSDTRSAAQRNEAKRSAERERKLADELQRDRLAAEKAVKPAAAVGITGRPAPAGASASDAKAAPKKDFVAVELQPRPPKAARP